LGSREKGREERKGGKGIKHGMDSLGKAMDRGCRLQSAEAAQLLGFGLGRAASRGIASGSRRRRRARAPE